MHFFHYPNITAIAASIFFSIIPILLAARISVAASYVQRCSLQPTRQSDRFWHCAWATSPPSTGPASWLGNLAEGSLQLVYMAFATRVAGKKHTSRTSIMNHKFLDQGLMRHWIKCIELPPASQHRQQGVQGIRIRRPQQGSLGTEGPRRPWGLLYRGWSGFGPSLLGPQNQSTLFRVFLTMA